MANQEKVSIFIDGGNFHHLVLKKLGIGELDFYFDDFAKFLANGRQIREQGKRFYTGTVREREGDMRSKEAMSKQTTFLTILKSFGWEIKTSKLRTRIERIVIDERVFNYQKFLNSGIKEIKITRTREKGVDVKIATDLIAGAIDNKYDTAIIVSSDSDLIPAIGWVRNRLKKKIEYIGFSIISKRDNEEDTRPSQSLITHSDIQRIFVASDLQPFIKKTLFKK